MALLWLRSSSTVESRVRRFSKDEMSADASAIQSFSAMGAMALICFIMSSNAFCRSRFVSASTFFFFAGNVKESASSSLLSLAFA